MRHGVLDGGGIDLAVERDVRIAGLIVPRGDTVLQSGDEVLVLATEDAEDAVHTLFIAGN